MLLSKYFSILSVRILLTISKLGSLLEIIAFIQIHNLLNNLNLTTQLPSFSYFCN